MNFDSNDADNQAMRVIEFLIESGHYKGFHKEDVIKTIARDANVLASALTLKPELTAEQKESLEPQLNPGNEGAFPDGWPKPACGENA
jgi:hypothetical protein